MVYGGVECIHVRVHACLSVCTIDLVTLKHVCDTETGV